MFIKNCLTLTKSASFCCKGTIFLLKTITKPQKILNMLTDINI